MLDFNFICKKKNNMVIPFIVNPVSEDKCNPSPCGPNSLCNNGICTCTAGYFGDPYQGCRPECVINSDCLPSRACVNNKCIDPCPGICGRNAECNVINHIPTCSCIDNYEGDPFTLCNPVESKLFCIISLLIIIKI